MAMTSCSVSQDEFGCLTYDKLLNDYNICSLYTSLPHDH